MLATNTYTHTAKMNKVLCFIVLCVCLKSIDAVDVNIERDAKLTTVRTFFCLIVVIEIACLRVVRKTFDSSISSISII